MSRELRLIATVVIALLTASGCTTIRFSAKEAFRTPDDEKSYVCQPLERRSSETLSRVSSFSTNCSIQHHHVEIRTENGPEKLAYDLAFLEFGADGRLLDPGQRSALLETLLAPPKVDTFTGDDQTATGTRIERYVIFFVHGWRNNASQFTKDPHRFQTALAYIASYITQRCSAECRPHVTGVFVGWPGAVINEYPDGVGAVTKSSASTAMVSMSFGTAFRTSNDIGPAVVQTIGGIIDEVRGASETQRLPARFLTIGHSAGANLLMSGLSGTVGDTSFSAVQDSIRPGSLLDEALKSHTSNTTFDPVLGDLVVLFAAASPATRWVSLQQRQLRNAVPGDRDPCQDDGCGWKGFRKSQRPILISITSACEGGLEAGQHANKVDCDRAVNSAFSIYQTISNPLRLIRGKGGRQERIAIGFYSHEAKVNNGGTAYFGPSHFVTDNSGRSTQIRPSTSLTSLRDPAASECRPAFSWLEAARLVKSPNWDINGTVRENRQAVLDDQARLQRFDRLVEGQPDDHVFGYVNGDYLRVQWMFTHKGVVGQSKRAITDSNTPFWNAVAHRSVMEAHGGFYSHALLCSITQLWLDPVVAP